MGLLEKAVTGGGPPMAPVMPLLQFRFRFRGPFPLIGKVNNCGTVQAI
jgi:hypothetical protein